MSTQVDLPLESGPVTDEAVRALPSMRAAVDLAVRASGLDQKQVYLDLGIDKGHWSRILSGQAHLPAEQLAPVMALCGNLLPLTWLAGQMGCGLHRLESEVERENRTLREELQQLRRDREVELRLLRDLRPAG